MVVKDEIKGFYDDYTEEQLDESQINLEENIVSSFIDRHPRHELTKLFNELQSRRESFE